MKLQLKADLMLLIVVSCWGFSFYLTDISAAVLNTFTLNAFRFIIAFVIAVLLAFPKLHCISAKTLCYSLLLGCILSLMYATMTFGIKNTVLSNSGFLCGLTVIFTPLLSCLIYRKPPEKKLMLVACMCVLGIALLTLTDGFQINQENLKGDLLCILCGLFYAVDLVITEKAVLHEEVNAFQLGILQLGVTGGISLILAFLLEKPHLPPTPKIWLAVLFLAIFCTGVAFIVQTIAQQYTSATHVGVINSLEPVFAGIVAYIFAGDVLSPKSYFGAALMVTGVIIMEIDFSDFCLKHKKLFNIKEEQKMTLNEVIVRRDSLMQSIMENEHLSKIYYDGQNGSPEEVECIKRVKLLNQAIETESSNDCGCGKNMRLNTLENLLRGAEAICEELHY